MPRLYVGSYMQGPEAERLSLWANSTAADPTCVVTKDGGTAKATALQKLHITWQFLGDLDSDEQSRVMDVLQEVHSQVVQTAGGELTIKYSAIELWPDSSSARVAVITPVPVDDKLSRVGTTLREALRPFIRVDQSVERNWRFMPHITVMRFKEASPDLTRLTESYQTVAPVVQTINSIDLIESHLGRDRSYESVLTLAMR